MDKSDVENGDARLRDITRRLGVAGAERLDVERAAAGVVARLRTVPWTHRPWLRIAAAVVLLLGGALVLRQVTAGPETAAAAHLVADDLTDLTAEELEQLLAVVNDTTELGATVPDLNGLDELDAQQLRAVLRSLEGEG